MVLLYAIFSERKEKNEVRYEENTGDVIASISEELSKDYEIYTDTYELKNAGSCTRIDASACVGGEVMPEQLQKVYILSVGEGTVVALRLTKLKAIK